LRTVVTANYWLDALSGVRAALPPLKNLGIGDRRITGAAANSPSRPTAAGHGYVPISARRGLMIELSVRYSASKFTLGLRVKYTTNFGNF